MWQAAILDKLCGIEYRANYPVPHATMVLTRRGLLKEARLHYQLGLNFYSAIVTPFSFSNVEFSRPLSQGRLFSFHHPR